MRRELNLAQAIVHFADAERPLGTREQVNEKIASLAVHASPSLMSILSWLQRLYLPAEANLPSTLVEEEQYIDTQFGPAKVVGYEANEILSDAIERILWMIRSAELRAFGRRNGSVDREHIAPAVASFARIIDQDGLCIAPKSFPISTGAAIWREVTVEFYDNLTEANEKTKGRTGPKPVQKTKAMDYLSCHPNAGLEEIVSETGVGKTTAHEALQKFRQTPNHGK